MPDKDNSWVNNRLIFKTIGLKNRNKKRVVFLRQPFPNIWNGIIYLTLALNLPLVIGTVALAAFNAFPEKVPVIILVVES